MGGWGERERVAGQETSSADEVIGLKIKRWRHLKPIPVNELSGAPGKGGDRRGQGGGRRAGPCARRSSERGSAPGRGLSGRGSGPVQFRGPAAPGQVPRAPLGGAGRPGESAPRPPPSAPARPPAAPVAPDLRPPAPVAGARPRAFSAAPQQVFQGVPPRPSAPQRGAEPFPPPWAVSSCLPSVKKRQQ